MPKLHDGRNSSIEIDSESSAHWKEEGIGSYQLRDGRGRGSFCPFLAATAPKLLASSSSSSSSQLFRENWGGGDIWVVKGAKPGWCDAPCRGVAVNVPGAAGNPVPSDVWAHVAGARAEASGLFETSLGGRKPLS